MPLRALITCASFLLCFWTCIGGADFKVVGKVSQRASSKMHFDALNIWQATRKAVTKYISIDFSAYVMDFISKINSCVVKISCGSENREFARQFFFKVKIWKLQNFVTQSSIFSLGCQCCATIWLCMPAFVWTAKFKFPFKTPPTPKYRRDAFCGYAARKFWIFIMRSMRAHARTPPESREPHANAWNVRAHIYAYVKPHLPLASRSSGGVSRGTRAFAFSIICS